MISSWATELNVTVRKCEERPDGPEGHVVYRLVDLFTTHSGSWEPSNKQGSITQWAHDKYLRSMSAPDYFDDAGGDHHLFARVLDENGQPIVQEGLVRYWSDGFGKLSDQGYDGYVRITPKQKSGWANQPVFNHFNPDRGESGAWCWCPEGASDVVVGGGLPNNVHISYFAVWQAQRIQETEPPVTPDADTGDAPIPEITELDEMRRRSWEQTGVTFNRDSVFANYARVHNLGAPLTNEYDVGTYRAQGFANGIVYAPVGQWERTSHMGW